jgi:hypothetical protein
VKEKICRMTYYSIDHPKREFEEKKKIGGKGKNNNNFTGSCQSMKRNPQQNDDNVETTVLFHVIYLVSLRCIQIIKYKLHVLNIIEYTMLHEITSSNP